LPTPSLVPEAPKATTVRYWRYANGQLCHLSSYDRSAIDGEDYVIIPDNVSQAFDKPVYLLNIDADENSLSNISATSYKDLSSKLPSNSMFRPLQAIGPITENSRDIIFCSSLDSPITNIINSPDKIPVYIYKLIEQNKSTWIHLLHHIEYVDVPTETAPITITIPDAYKSYLLPENTSRIQLHPSHYANANEYIYTNDGWKDMYPYNDFDAWMTSLSSTQYQDTITINSVGTLGYRAIYYRSNLEIYDALDDGSTVALKNQSNLSGYNSIVVPDNVISAYVLNASQAQILRNNLSGETLNYNTGTFVEWMQNITGDYAKYWPSSTIAFSALPPGGLVLYHYSALPIYYAEVNPSDRAWVPLIYQPQILNGNLQLPDNIIKAYVLSPSDFSSLKSSGVSSGGWNSYHFVHTFEKHNSFYDWIEYYYNPINGYEPNQVINTATIAPGSMIIYQYNNDYKYKYYTTGATNNGWVEFKATSIESLSLSSDIYQAYVLSPQDAQSLESATQDNGGKSSGGYVNYLQESVDGLESWIGKYYTSKKYQSMSTIPLSVLESGGLVILQNNRDVKVTIYSTNSSNQSSDSEGVAWTWLEFSSEINNFSITNSKEIVYTVPSNVIAAYLFPANSYDRLNYNKANNITNGFDTGFKLDGWSTGGWIRYLTGSNLELWLNEYYTGFTKFKPGEKIIVNYTSRNDPLILLQK
jgi:hypothetical protein